MADLASLRATVHGRVQGVFFRAFARKWAADLGVYGYVRNMPDGSVEVLAEGEREQLEKLLEQLRKGPPAADVTGIDTAWSDYGGKYRSFSIGH